MIPPRVRDEEAQAMPGRTSWRSAWLPVACWLAVIFGLSSIPDLGPPDVGLPMADKLAHLGEYGVLGALFARALPGRWGPVRALLVGLLLGAVVGTLDEAYQSGTPGRDVSGFDTLADALGAAVGCLVGSWWLARSGRARSQAPGDTIR
jgi:VanZ family protein